MTPHLPRGRTIVVVEDEATVLAVVTRLLERANYVVVPFSVPNAALSWLVRESVPPALLITDVILPGINGFELCGAARVRLPELPVLFMSGYALESLPFEATELPANTDMITKPFGAAELRAAVSRILEPPANRRSGTTAA